MMPQRLFVVWVLFRVVRRRRGGCPVRQGPSAGRSGRLGWRVAGCDCPGQFFLGDRRVRGRHHG